MTSRSEWHFGDLVRSSVGRTLNIVLYEAEGSVFTVGLFRPPILRLVMWMEGDFSLPLYEPWRWSVAELRAADPAWLIENGYR